MERKTALVVGATGLVGTELVKILVEAKEYEKVVVWVRKSTGMTNEKLEETIIDFDKIESYKLDKAKHVFCCLGTTIKKAKTKENFKKVDFDYPVSLAKRAKESDVSNFLVISAMGANEKSGIFYNAVKGQMEEELKRIGLKGLKIFRPSLLLGERNEFRLGEKIAEVVSKGIPFLFNGSLKKYKPIYGSIVAKAMYKAAVEELPGCEVFESKEIEVKGSL
ncbi:oxidoreductase [Bacillus sp. DJP31]|uniref:oxidoreductase n=1 Tax=Bacillus sp. DJP31 TaxID=3409789 RepID=UPI003BB6FC12